jgi:hypothetical protein
MTRSSSCQISVCFGCYLRIVKIFVHLSPTWQFNMTPEMHSLQPKGRVISGNGNKNFFISTNRQKFQYLTFFSRQRPVTWCSGVMNTDCMLHVPSTKSKELPIVWGSFRLVDMFVHKFQRQNGIFIKSGRCFRKFHGRPWLA